jgi:hypothetical protein
MQGDLWADRAGQQSGQSSAALTAVDDERCAAGGVQEHARRIAGHRSAVDTNHDPHGVASRGRSACAKAQPPEGDVTQPGRGT